MVLNPEAIRRRLLRLEEVVSRLEQLARLEPRGLRENFRDRWATERGLQLGAEIIFDGNHILSAYFGASAQDYEDILSQLAAHGVIDSSLYDRLKGLGGFRNVLVHGYLHLDSGRVDEFLRNAPVSFSSFARAIQQWIDRTVK